MEQGQLNRVANLIWGIADDVLRDLYVRGKYRDVILPMTVLRRLDAVLEPTKQAVLDMKTSLDKAGITNQDQALRQAAGQAFDNTSAHLKARSSFASSTALMKEPPRSSYGLPSGAMTATLTMPSDGGCHRSQIENA
jgi:type I restriction-modification system DNA methylase subunit